MAGHGRGQDKLIILADICHAYALHGRPWKMTRQSVHIGAHMSRIRSRILHGRPWKMIRQDVHIGGHISRMRSRIQYGRPWKGTRHAVHIGGHISRMRIAQ